MRARFIRSLGAALGVATAGACADATVTLSAEVTKTDSANVAIVTLGDSLGAYASLVATDTIHLRGAPEDLFSGNPYIVQPLRNGGTLLSDWQLVAAFDSSGQYSGIVMPEGRGPGEITTLAGMWQSSDDSLWVADFGTRRISRFSPDIRYVRAVEYPRFSESAALSVFGYLNVDTTAVVEFGLADASAGPGMVPIEYRVGTWVMDGATMLAESRKFSETQRFPEGVLPPGVNLGAPFAPIAQWVPYGRCMVFGYPDRWALRIESPERDGRFTPVALLRAPRDVATPFTAERKERFITQAISRAPFVERAMRDHMIFPAALPSFSRVLTSADGAIWVQRYREPTAREPDHWTIVDPVGISAWRLELPAGSRLLAVRPQGAFVATRDADDVETQAWLRLPALAGIRLLPTCRQTP